jgi:hypothetical protein
MTFFHDLSVYSEFIMFILGVIGSFMAWGATLYGGWLLAKWSLNMTEKHNYEKDKIFTSNDLLLKVSRMTDALISIKATYQGGLSSSPVQRAIRIPVIPLTETNQDFQFGKLSFLAESKASRKGWRNLPRIMSFFKNYNLLLTLIKERNELRSNANHLFLSDQTESASIQLSEKDVVEKFGALNMTMLIDLTEQIILLVDGLLLEGNDFLLNFHSSIEDSIDKEGLKKIGLKLLGYSNDGNENRTVFFKLSPTLDYAATAKITGRSIQELQNNFNVSQITHLADENNQESQ